MDETPLAWLWAELEQRLGRDETEALRLQYNAVNQAYQKRLVARKRAERQAETERIRAEDANQALAELEENHGTH